MNDFELEINTRRITRLCHFVKTSKLLHILNSEEGIKASNFIQQDILKSNDDLRLDGKKDYINCSVQYPNTFYLDRIKDNDPIFTDWAIIFIDPKIITLDTNLFCPVNAATSHGAHIEKGFEAFKRMFSYKLSAGRCISRTSNMVPNATTDIQAEVLVYKNIPRRFIIGVALVNKQLAKEKKAAWSVIKTPEIDVYIAPELFSRNLSNKLRRGEYPLEHQYVED